MVRVAKPAVNEDRGRLADELWAVCVVEKNSTVREFARHIAFDVLQYGEVETALAVDVHWTNVWNPAMLLIMEAALALWKYCEDSARVIFGDALGNYVADQILKAIEKVPEGLTRNDLRDLFGRHRSSEEIGTALQILGDQNLVECEKEDTGGRPVERWFACNGAARKARKARKGEGE